MRVRKVVFLSVAAIVAASVGAYVARQNTGGAPGSAAAAAGMMMAMPVPVTPVVKRALPIYLEYPSRMESIRNISLQARVPGYIAEQVAPDGADVKEGDLLYRVDPRDLEAAFDQMKAQAARDAASLAYAQSNFDRGSELVKSGFVAKDAYDQRESALRQAEAAVAMDQAAMRTTQLNLSYAEIRAPFVGRLGRNQAPIGTLVSVAGAALNTLVQLDPIYVTFNPSETELAQIQQARAAGRVEAEVFAPGDDKPRQRGELTFIDNNVDRSTGTITARATISNPDFSLLPGEYVHVRLRIKETPDALMVPQVAIGSSQLGK
ncbi:MAG: efflux RND transporter periplasmic adaptor subunit, partial [Hyphomicrobiales bacterium]|nr:efflux RND transporter periplasmic adaptor subunit [Hyphomicrobiales bacterium]